MASLPPALNFPETEEEICKKWKDEDTFRTQDRLSLERGDEVRREETAKDYSNKRTTLRLERYSL